MPEVLTLTTPDVTPPVTTAGYTISFIGLQVDPTPAIVVLLKGTNGERVEVRTATDAEALALLTALNTANLSVKSLQKRCLEWCAGKLARLAGTVTGIPS